MHRSSCARLTLLAALSVAAAPAAAQAPKDPAGGGPRAPLWEAGLFATGGTQQAYPGSRQQVRAGIVLPFVVYRGQLLRSEQGTVGLRAVRTADAELDIGLAGSFGSSANRSEVRRGLPDIGMLLEFGPRLNWRLGAAPWGGRLSLAVPLRGVFDASHGMASRGLALEPTLAWADRGAGGWTWGASLGLLAGDRKLADTFYGVDDDQVTPLRAAWRARGGLIATRLALQASRTLAPDWRVFIYARADTVAGAANRNSPLVDRRTGHSGGLGLSWTWARSDAPAAP